jgi:hypothetical protein
MRLLGALAFVAAVTAGFVPATARDAAEATISASAEVTTDSDAKVEISVADLKAKVKKYVHDGECASLIT